VVFFFPRCFPSYSLLVFRTKKNGREGRNGYHNSRGRGCTWDAGQGGRREKRIALSVDTQASEGSKMVWRFGVFAFISRCLEAQRLSEAAQGGGSVCPVNYTSSRYHNKKLDLATYSCLGKGWEVGIVAACCANTLLIRCMLTKGKGTWRCDERREEHAVHSFTQCHAHFA
jgi:hypothetical protein